MVEAAGVEPASEKVVSKETTCLFRSCLWHYPETFAAYAQSGQETHDASLKFSSCNPDEVARPAYCATSTTSP
jgi:hypothetical protein